MQHTILQLKSFHVKHFILDNKRVKSTEMIALLSPRNKCMGDLNFCPLYWPVFKSCTGRISLNRYMGDFNLCTFYFWPLLSTCPLVANMVVCLIWVQKQKYMMLKMWMMMLIRESKASILPPSRQYCNEDCRTCNSYSGKINNNYILIILQTILRLELYHCHWKKLEILQLHIFRHYCFFIPFVTLVFPGILWNKTAQEKTALVNKNIKDATSKQTSSGHKQEF